MKSHNRVSIGAVPSTGICEWFANLIEGEESAYVNRNHVRFGSAENSAAKIGEDGVLSVHYSHQRQSYGWIRGMAGLP